MTRAQNRDAKAERLISEGRCHELASVPGKLWIGVVVGDTGRYTVYSVHGDYLPELGTGLVPPTVGCQCKAFEFAGVGTERSCVHTDAAARLRIRSTPIDDVFRMVGGGE
jgi:hypothetical protein